MASRLLATLTLTGSGTVVSAVLNLNRLNNYTLGILTVGSLGGGVASILCGNGTNRSPLKIIDPADGSASNVVFITNSHIHIDVASDDIQFQLTTATSALTTIFIYMTARK